jgi:hypothetical protein
MAPSPQTSSTSSFSNQTSKVATLDRSTITWLVVLACIITVAFVVVACLLCRCRSTRKNAQKSRGYSIHDGRNDFHAWNRHASPTHTVPPPAYGGYGDVKSKADQQTSIAVPPQAAMKASVVMEPMVVEEAGSDGLYTRSNKKTSRYYGGFSARLSRMSQIGRAM